MLVLSRRSGERIYVGDDVVITICAARRGNVRLGITAPPEIRILREEVSEAIPVSANDVIASAMPRRPN